MMHFVFLAVGAAAAIERSDLRVARPQALVDMYPNGIDETPALFGIPAVGHGASISGEVVYSIPGDEDGCAPIDQDQTHKLWPQSGIVILLVDRGNCSFVTKVQHAQDAGAQACIVVDNRDEVGLPYMADDGKGALITIPSLLIHKNDGQAIKNFLLGNATANPPVPGVLVEMTISWNMPSPDGIVEWSLWHTSDDESLYPFYQKFRSVAQALGNHSLFEPHFPIIRGEPLGCFNPNNTALKPCGVYCTNQGRYCSTDPERDAQLGLTGADVVRENMRQICVHKITNSTGSVTAWWDYALAFHTDCIPGKEATFNEACSRSVMTKVGIDADAVMRCVNGHGGYGDDAGPNSEMDEEMDLYDALDAAVYFLPAVLINEVPYRGSLSCPTYETSSCGVLKSICAGYAVDTEPAACFTDPGCNIGQQWDTCRTCGGRGQDFCGMCWAEGDSRWVAPDVGAFDECGHCMSRLDPAFNQGCLGCDGTPNGPPRDFCGNCYPEGDERFVSASEGIHDQCGQCMKRGDPRENQSCLGCDGTPNGPPADFCGYCWPSASDPRFVSAKDAIHDACGRCMKRGDPAEGQSCLGCDGVPNGPPRDACGRCLSASDPKRIPVGQPCTDTTRTNVNETEVPVGAIVAICAVSVLAIGLFVFCYMKRKQNAMRADIDALLKEYLPLDVQSQQRSSQDDPNLATR